MIRTDRYKKEICDLFEYNPSSPSGLVWKNTKGRGNNLVLKGSFAGFKGSRKRWQVSHNKKVYFTHIIVWLFFNELDENKIIDHIDGNVSNNKIENLRSVPQKINCRNKRKQSNNTSGVTGVSYNKQRKTWVVYYVLDSKVIHERLPTKEKAIERRLEIETTLLKHKDYSNRHGKDSL